MDQNLGLTLSILGLLCFIAVKTIKSEKNLETFAMILSILVLLLSVANYYLCNT